MYSFLLDINDRRSYNLELFKKESRRKGQTPSFVIDVPNVNNFNILSFNFKQLFKSFEVNQQDIDLDDCTVSCVHNDGAVLVNIQHKIQPALFDLNLPDTEEPQTTETGTSFTFEDLDNLDVYNQPEPEVQKDTTPASTSSKRGFESHILGPLNPFITVKYEINDYNFKLVGNCTKEWNDNPVNRDQFNIIIQLHGNETIYTQTINVCLSHPRDFLGIALDFGSESSQMAIKQYNKGQNYTTPRPKIENLYANILQYHKFKGWINKDSNATYYQEEADTNFYKSLFFLKSSIEGTSTLLEDELFIPNQPENLKMLVEVDEGYNKLQQKEFKQIPNLKIIQNSEDFTTKFHFEYVQDFYPTSVNLLDLKDKVYNSILETFIMSQLMKDLVMKRPSKRNVRMQLLVPNNYDNHEVKNIQQQLHNIFTKIKKSSYFEKVLSSWEVLTISESDAAFIGYINKEGVQAKAGKDYIIIDSGKGTTDFSIIRTGSENLYDLTSIYRNGFTGAGNMITYAIFETLLHHIRILSSGDGSDVSFIKSQILGALENNDLESSNLFYNELERLKFNYRPKAEESSILNNWNTATVDTTDSGALSMKGLSRAQPEMTEIVKILKNINYITDFYGYIEDACHFISDNVVNYLKLIKDNKPDLDIQGIVLTGRAFKFEMLADMIKEKLQEQLNVTPQCIELLKGNELKDISIKGVFNNGIKVNAEKTGQPIQIVFNSPQSQKDTPAAQQEESTNKKPWHTRLRNLFINDLADLQGISAVNTDVQTLNIEQIRNSQFLIGCKRYDIKSNELLSNTDSRHSISVEFAHDGYKVRKMIDNKVVAISDIFEKNRSEQSDDALIVPSLFPNYIKQEYIQSLQESALRQKPPSETESDNNKLFF